MDVTNPDAIPDLECPNEAFDADFHPTQDLISICTVAGDCHIYHYGKNGHNELHRKSIHEASLRTLMFSMDGQSLYLGGSNGCLSCVNTNGEIAWQTTGAHDAPINTMTHCTDTAIAVGDDDGHVKIWDLRTKTAALNFDHHEDVITDLTVDLKRHTLLTTSGDGTLSACDLRKGKLIQRSDQLEDELLSVSILKNGQKVVCGSQDGVIAIYTWGAWADMDDRFPGHPQSIDAMLKLDEDTIITGSSDGIIRIVQILPNRLLGIVGEHSDFPIETLRRDRTGNIIASTSHDQHVKFWDVSYLQEDPAAAAAEASASSSRETSDSSKKTQNNFFGDL